MENKNLELIKDIVGAENIDSQGIVYPLTVEQVVRIVKLANQAGFPLYPMGQGLKFQSFIPKVDKGIIVSLKKLNKIIEYRPDNMSIEVEAGITTGELLEKLAPDNIFYPIDIDNLNSTLGGQIAANYYGRKKYMYKSSRFQVLGLEFVSPQGEIIRVGGRTVKNVSGYDISQMLVGSWGAFGIITKITLRVRPRPEKNLMLKLTIDNLQELTDIAGKILEERMSLASLTFEHRENKFNLYLELEGFQDTVELQGKRLKEQYPFIDAPSLTPQQQLRAKISVPLTNYLNLLLELEKIVADNLDFHGNITNGIVELDLPEDRIEEIKGRVDKLQGALVFDRKIIVGQGNDPNYRRILENIKKQVDPNNILFPEILLKGVEIL
ncbi:MAG: FAD-binding oxidoreductase [Clostridia bacterium]|nr:FAD-binding oxidoreductase [Clostridia bacterium]